MSSESVRVITGNEATSRMQEVYASGFCTGMSSCLATFLGDKVPESERDAYVQDFADKMMADPIMREVINRQIAEIMTGTDSGPQNYTLPGAES